MRIVVMGVQGSGKSTVGRLLAERLGAAFVDGDDLHPPANRAKMAAGVPLGDADRAPWLDAVAAALDRGPDVVVACSALRRVYRDRIRAGAPDAVFVHLHGSAALLRERIAGRRHEFMPPGLLDSQLATLEPLGDDERGILADIALPPGRIADRVAGMLPAAG